VGAGKTPRKTEKQFFGQSPGSPRPPQCGPPPRKKKPPFLGPIPEKKNPNSLPRPRFVFFFGGLCCFFDGFFDFGVTLSTVRRKKKVTRPGPPPAPDTNYRNMLSRGQSKSPPPLRTAPKSRFFFPQARFVPPQPRPGPPLPSGWARPSKWVTASSSPPIKPPPLKGQIAPLQKPVPWVFFLKARSARPPPGV